LHHGMAFFSELRGDHFDSARVLRVDFAAALSVRQYAV
jgi:hypothetical protein